MWMPELLKYCRPDYSKDKNNVYSPENGWIQRVNGANPKTIKVLNQFYLKDDKTVFFNDKKILGADANSFIALDKENGYAKDKNGVYYFDMNKLNKFSLNGIFLK